ncbi:MAG: DUF1501 domain-containing protein [Planctomycetia bacterium]
MLTLLGKKQRFCDGVSRRSFLGIGGLAMGGSALGGFGLPQILQAQEASGGSSHKAVINVFLAGGPPHLDMWDMKPDAPAEVRGEMKPIATNVSGIDVCECMPRLAKMADKLALIRSMVGSEGHHDGFQCFTGHTHQSLSALGGRPAMGSALAKIAGPVNPAVPPYVGLSPSTAHQPWGDPGKPGFLGASYAPFRPDGPGRANLTLNGVTLDELADRKKLLAGFDQLRRDVDATGAMRGMDAFTERALGVLTSSRLLDALDLTKEHPRVRERYGDGKPYKFQYDGAPTANDHLLMARRLVEVGVRCVTISFGRWDSHGDNFGLVRDHLPKLDQAVSALIEDLEIRGMLNDVSVVVWGEFGRTPRINPQAGRDHWPQVGCAMLAGGGIRGGQVVGATNRLGEYAVARPVTFEEVFATLYHNLGINTDTTTLVDPAGRPQYLVDAKPMAELI